MTNSVIKRRAHIVDMPCPNGQTFCIRNCNNSIRGCALCEPYAYGRDKRGNIPPNFPMPAIPLACAILPNLVQIAEVIWFDDAIEPEFELIIEFH